MRILSLIALDSENLNTKVQGVRQLQAEANPWHQDEEKKDSN